MKHHQSEQEAQRSENRGQLDQQTAWIPGGRQQFGIDYADQEIPEEDPELAALRQAWSRFHQLNHLGGDVGGILLDSQLREDGFQVRRSAQGTQLRRRIVRHHPPFVQNDDARTDPLDSVEFMRAEQYQLPCRGQPLNQISQYQRGSHVEAREWFIEQQHVRVVQKRRGEKHLLPHALRIPVICP